MRNFSPLEYLSVASSFVQNGIALRRMPWRPIEDIKEWQFQKLRSLVSFAYQYVPFYHDLYSEVGFTPNDLQKWEDFYRLPIVTKEQVIANYPLKTIASNKVVEKLFISRSSGSSGKVLDIAYDREAMNIYVLAGLRLYQMGFNYRPWHRQLYIYTSPYPFRSFFGLYPLKFVSTLTPISIIIREMKHFQADLLVCYPSHLRQIMAHMTVQDRLQIRPRVISLNSEMSSQAERNEMEVFFGCPVLDEYSSEELTRIAAQCQNKNYHVFEDINYIESNDGIILGTNLHNFAMPMIRYKQNDLGTISEKTCECGRSFRILENFLGRKNDCFTLPSGKVISSGFLLDATYGMLLTHRNAVQEFCLIQKSEGDIQLQIVPSTEWNVNIEQNIASNFMIFFAEPLHFKVQVVETCEKTLTGKRNPIISYVGRQNA